MDDNFYNNLINEYINFKNKLIRDINSSFISFSTEDCYLIDQVWYNDLLICFEQYRKYGNLSLPKRSPIFINNISDFIKYEKLGININ